MLLSKMDCSIIAKLGFLCRFRYSKLLPRKRPSLPLTALVRGILVIARERIIYAVLEFVLPVKIAVASIRPMLRKTDEIERCVICRERVEIASKRTYPQSYPCSCTLDHPIRGHLLIISKYWADGPFHHQRDKRKHRHYRSRGKGTKRHKSTHLERQVTKRNRNVRYGRIREVSVWVWLVSISILCSKRREP